MKKRYSKLKKRDILDLYSSPNIADMLTDEEKRRIGSLVCEEFELDKRSMNEWLSMNKEAIELAKQIATVKNTPWQKAANVKFPLISIAAIQSAARQLAEIIKNDKVVYMKIYGDDPTGELEELARLLSNHMSAQLLVETDDWEPGTDRLCTSLSIVGLMWRKTYWDEMAKRNISEVCAVDEIIVNKEIKSAETARRITHCIKLYKNDIISGVRFGIYDEDILDEIDPITSDPNANLSSNYQEEGHEVLEQHRFLDLDGDGYEEPYIVTVHKKSQKIIRIYRCFDLENIEYNASGEIWKIDPTPYFTDYHYLPNPDGSFLSIGMGQLLMPINESVNGLINQLLNAGTLATSPSGILARNFKLKSGEMDIRPGTFLKTDIQPDDLQNSMKQLDFKEPSSVLFNLLGTLIQSGKEVASITDILQGQQPAQNAPATTVLALIEQSLKVPSSIQRRFYRSLTKEFRKLYRLNSIYLDETPGYKKANIGTQVTREMYAAHNFEVLPVSDPAFSSDAQRLARAKAMMEMVPMLPQSGQQEVLRNWLHALQTPDAQILKILTPEEGQPTPQQMEAQKEAQESQQKMQIELMDKHLKAEELSIKESLSQSQAALNTQLVAESKARAMKMFADTVLAQEALQSSELVDHMDLSIKATQKMEKLAAQQAKDLEG